MLSRRYLIGPTDTILPSLTVEAYTVTADSSPLASNFKVLVRPTHDWVEM